MNHLIDTITNLFETSGFFNITYKNVIMILLGMHIAVFCDKKEYEPLLLIPIAFGMFTCQSVPEYYGFTKPQCKR